MRDLICLTACYSSRQNRTLPKERAICVAVNIMAPRGLGVSEASLARVKFGEAGRVSNSDRLGDMGKVALGGHGEEAVAAAAGCPNLADGAFFFGVGGVVQMFAFVFDGQDPAVGELANEVRVKPVLRGLEAEGRVSSRKIADPELNAGQAIQELRALKFLGDLAARGGFF